MKLPGARRDGREDQRNRDEQNGNCGFHEMRPIEVL
jgi:hypothetical protein